MSINQKRADGKANSWKRGSQKEKKRLHQITVALNLTALKFNYISTMDFLEIRYNGKLRFNEYIISADNALTNV